MNDLYIFDLDGTLADIEHRKYLLDQKDNPLRWREFYALCGGDEPKLDVINTMERLKQSGADIYFFSGRSDEVRGLTVDWLTSNTSFTPEELETVLCMRENGDCTPDDDLKRSWYNNMLVVDRDRLVAVFDDRDRIVKMWREEGVTCYQVAPGNF